MILFDQCIYLDDKVKWILFCACEAIILLLWKKEMEKGVGSCS